jgi:Domain of unknown function (DUF4214)
MSPFSKQLNEQYYRQPPLSNFFTLAELLQGNDQQFVSNAYQALLGRGADSDGLNTYTSLLLGGKSRVELLVELRRSGEGKAHAACVAGLDAATSLVELLAHQNDAFVSCAFQTLLGRPVDANAFVGYGKELANGIARLYLLREIRKSGEFSSRNAIALEIEQVAQHPHGVPPSLVNDDADVRIDIDDNSMPGPPASATQLLKLAGRQFIHGLHLLLLARIANDDELENHLSRIKSGTSKTEIVQAISQSEERRARRAMLSQLDSAVEDLQLQQQPFFGRAARLRSERLDRLVETQRINMMEYQLAAISQRFKHQLEALSKQTVNSAEESGSEKKRVLKLNQLSPFARDIYFQIKTGLEEHEEHGV